jgi:hypothetical protein
VPRHTHPRLQRKHPRAHTRLQRDLVIRRNWGRAKARYGSWRVSALHPELARRDPTQEGAWWPFTLPNNAFARNPFNHCSCEMCSVRPDARRRQRHREAQSWSREAERELGERERDEVMLRWTHSQPQAARRWDW